MRQFKRIKSMDERNALVTDAGLRDQEWRAYVEAQRIKEVAEFSEAYTKWYEACERDPAWPSRRGGAYFRIPNTTQMSSAKALILERYALWVRETNGHPLMPLDSPFQWGPYSQLYGYHPPYQPFMPEIDNIFVRKRNLDM